MWKYRSARSGFKYGRPAVVGGSSINRKIREFQKRNTPSAWWNLFGGGGGPTGRLATRVRGRRLARGNGRKIMRKRRIVRKYNSGKMAIYGNTLKHIMCQPSVEKDSLAFNMNRTGNSVTGYKEWYNLSMSISPADCDRMLSGSTNLAATSVISTTEVFCDGGSTQLTFRNNANTDAIVSIYKCIARRDISANSHAIIGANPSLFTTGFTDIPQESKSTTKPGYTANTSTPYGSPAFCSLFKIKKIYAKTLLPGNQDSVRYNVKKGRLVKKASYGLSTSQSFGTTYLAFKGQCFYLIGVHGGIVHNQASVVTTMTNTDLSPCTGGFNLDCLVDRRVTYRTPYVTTTRAAGQYGLVSPAITAANQDEWHENAPAEQAIGA